MVGGQHGQHMLLIESDDTHTVSNNQSAVFTHVMQQEDTHPDSSRCLPMQALVFKRFYLQGSSNTMNIYIYIYYAMVCTE